MRSVDFYEFVGIVVPGAVLLLAVGLLLDTGPAEQFLNPDALGKLGVYLVLAYVVGHLVQAAGNGFEALYWRLWRGMPTDWPTTRPKHGEARVWKDSLEKHSGQTCHHGDMGKWRRMVHEARAKLYASNRASRLVVFNGNYGMFRGLFVVLILVATFAWHAQYNSVYVYILLGITAGLTVYRMHHFAVNYARELFANVAAFNEVEGNREQKGGGNDT